VDIYLTWSKLVELNNEAKAREQCFERDEYYHTPNGEDMLPEHYAHRITEHELSAKLSEELLYVTFRELDECQHRYAYYEYVCFYLSPIR
jgi:hypothetical protein